MKYILNEKEAKQLKKQGYHVVTGEFVEVCTMPEWIRKRAERLDAELSKPSTVEAYDKMVSEADIWTGAELKSLARALGADRNPNVRELLNS